MNTRTNPGISAPNPEATAMANANTVLTPRFYTTDFAALERIDLSLVRKEWDQMAAEFDNDGNVDHFVRDAEFAEQIQELSPALRQEFLDFMVSSVTSEYSGCVLYDDVEKKVSNPDIKKIMGYMRRDEARHAGFINRALKDFGMSVDLGFLKREKKVKYFRPKFIYYATYLSEKIGYARYITIFRHLEAHPEKRFHPIFRWFEQWCNDEFRHGEAFALIMRADPKLLRGHNRLWIRFFLLAVYATMFVRDHARPEMHKAMGLNVEEYDAKVFTITSEISRQVFPFTLNTDNPKFWQGLRHLLALSQQAEKLDKQAGVLPKVRKLGLGIRAGVTFLRLYMLPTIPNEAPAQVRMVPAW